MSEALVREIAEQILQEQILSNWRFYALLLAVSLVGSVTSAFIVSYVRKRAETYATKADLSELLQQLRATTAAVEEVKSAISHSDWLIREWKTLRRIKLEELLAMVFEVTEWLDRNMSFRFSDELKTDEKSPISKLQVVSRLYFPELLDEVYALELAYRKYRVLILTTQKQILEANQDVSKLKSIHDPLMLDMEGHCKNLLNAIHAIEQKAPKLMQEIAGV